MAHTSSSPSKKTQSVKFQGRFETNYNSKEAFELVAKIRRNQEQKIELSIKNRRKKRRNIIQEKMTSKNQAEKNQTKDLKCATHLLCEKFRNMSEEKKTIVRDLGFGGLMHIPPLRVDHKLLKELANSFKLGKNTLETGYGSFRVRQTIIGAALGLNTSGDLFPQKINYKDLSEDNKQIFKRFQGKTLKSLTYEMMTIAVDNEQDRLMFKRIFILYIQMAFFLPTTINKISPVYLAPIFKMDIIKERNWRAHVLNFIIKGITDYNLKKKKAIDDSEVYSTSKSETEEDSEEPTRKQPTRTSKKTQSKKKKVIVEDSSPESEIRTEELDEFLREKNEKSAAQGEKEADLQSTEGHYVSSETIPDVNLGSDDPSFQGHTDQSSVNEPAESMLSLVEESASEPAEENMMVVRVETQSQTEALSITPEPPQKPEESTPMLPPAPSKINPVPEDAAALMMMAQTSSYIPKKGSIPSFSLGLTNSSQEEATTQEGAAMQDGERAKTPETPKLLEQLGDLVEKIASGRVTTKGKSPQIRKESGG
ncbi:hypothetical protein Ahy_B10g105176 [Arachis hypogaea]|uniref:Aminotransferase-like plant mobile domain-containing protein n=1 Tax=Arachis hypogaea TaxID=3818 RepID=A0A444X7G9_ARAHY|nr:hypothetical protein Ahy_B10g105176 [Arachis hypogaea]